MSISPESKPPNPPTLVTAGIIFDAGRVLIAKIASGEPVPLECQDYHWVPIKDLPEYDFAPADLEIVGQLLKLNTLR